MIGRAAAASACANTAIACSPSQRDGVARPLLYGLAMQQRLSVTVAALAAAAPLSIVHADPSAPAPPAPSVGVGLAQTLDGTSGLSLRYGRDLQLQLVLGGVFQRFQFRPEDPPLDSSRLDASARLLLPLIEHERGWVGAVVGVNGHRYRGERDTLFTGSAEVGLHAEWFVVPALSLGFEVGTAVIYVPDTGGVMLPDGAWTDGGVSTSTGGNDVSGAASVTYWLDAADARPGDQRPLRFGVGATRGVEATGVALAADLGRLRLELTGHRRDFDAFDASYAATTGSLGALYEVARRGPASLSAGLRLGASWSSSNVEDDAWTVVGEVPLRLELDATSWLTLHGEGGLVATVPVEDLDEVGRASVDGRGVTGRVGFTVWL
jgi:hypothetical protein